MYRTLEVLGPEHEYSIVDERLNSLPNVDKVIKELKGKIVNTVSCNGFSFGKELQSHVAEIKATKPFPSPTIFEDTMYEAVLKINDVLERHFHAHLMGGGMHPLLDLNDARIWSHRDRSIYKAMDDLFNIRQHGWLNIQSFQLNLSYSSEPDGVRLHNVISTILPYLPAISAASPIYEARIGAYVDNRLYFYKNNQKEAPSIIGDVIPEYITSFKKYREVTIEKYSNELQTLNADACLINKEWLNSRGAIFRFDRNAIEIRVMDEQECVKSDVALSCFIRALLRGLFNENEQLPHNLLVEDFNRVIREGLSARVLYPDAKTAQPVCLHFYDIATKHAQEDEKRYLWLIKKRILEGNLSNLIARDVCTRAQKTSQVEAIRDIYLKLVSSLSRNEPYS